MYQVAFEMYPPETRAQLKFVVGEGDPPPHQHALAMYLHILGG